MDPLGGLLPRDAEGVAKVPCRQEDPQIAISIWVKAGPGALAATGRRAPEMETDGVGYCGKAADDARAASNGEVGLSALARSPLPPVPRTLLSVSLRAFDNYVLSLHQEKDVNLHWI